MLYVARNGADKLYRKIQAVFLPQIFRNCRAVGSLVLKEEVKAAVLFDRSAFSDGREPQDKPLLDLV